MGTILSARLSTAAPHFIRKKKLSGAKLRGVQYEAKFHRMMASRFGDFYSPNPWIAFREKGRKGDRWCQPDGLLFDFSRGIITIIECKLKHCSRAYYQLTQLYGPLVSFLFSKGWEVRFLEVVKWYDCAIAFPCKPVLCSEITLAPPAPAVGVHICKP